MLKSLLSTTLFLLTGITLVGQSPTPQQMIDEFFSIYESGKPVEAIEYLYSSNSQEWLDMIQADIDNVKNRFGQLKSIVGVYYGKEKLLEEDLGGSLKMVIYMVRYDRQPIRFSFQYYKPGDEWRLYGFSYDDDLPEEFKQKVKEKLE